MGSIHQWIIVHRSFLKIIRKSTLSLSTRGSVYFDFSIINARKNDFGDCLMLIVKTERERERACAPFLFGKFDSVFILKFIRNSFLLFLFTQKKKCFLRGSAGSA